MTSIVFAQSPYFTLCDTSKISDQIICIKYENIKSHLVIPDDFKVDLIDSMVILTSAEQKGKCIYAELKERKSNQTKKQEKY